MGANASHLDPPVITRAFKVYDDNEDGKIELKEFCMILQYQADLIDEKLCQLCFSLVDTDGSNYIDQKEFHSFFVAYTKLENPDIYDLIGCAADVNGDDTIDGKELKRVLDFKHVKMVEEMNKKSMTKTEFVDYIRKNVKL
ncbi:EF-hand_domain [Hexamita inflata]|uniref:EF-hand domain n=1 Tax=Hexamita inflata TaxID=28002 RepID=A0AA86NMW2_9EUKA|nr:EF-hand domain [Hexamita inflata]